jgi:hypothetical protein
VGHIVLLGDSIFDNACYVPGGPPVIDQLGQILAVGWRGSLLAVDGHTTIDVANQLRRLPADATHLVVSVGGNDALGEASILNEPVCTVGEALSFIQDVRSRFRNSYCEMLQALSAVGKPTAACTVYDSIPHLGPAEQAALSAFNEIILREALSAGLSVIDLRLVCQDEEDYSKVNPIEPGVPGGAKITRVIAEFAMNQDFGGERRTIYI